MNDHPSARAATDAILTVTLNPSLDLPMSVEQFVPDRKLRAFDDRREAGGSVNVSRVLRRVDVPTRSFAVVGVLTSVNAGEPVNAGPRTLTSSRSRSYAERGQTEVHPWHG